MSLVMLLLAAATPQSDGWSALIRCETPTVYDGDTIRCVEGGKRVRKRASGIHAPEIDTSRCGRIECVPGDPIAARDALLGVIAGHTLNYRYRVNKRGEPQLDPYRRQVIIMYVQGANVACPLLKAGLVVYAEKYDHKGTIKRECKLRQ